MTGAAGYLTAFLRGLGLPEPVPEFRFARPRRWRFDLSYPQWKIAIEIDGGVWSRGRHVRGSGYEKDMEKLNHAARLGWRVYRFSTGMVEDGRALAFLGAALEGLENG